MGIQGIKGETNRIFLGKAVPLSTPLSVFLDASSVCNFRCSFCPHGNGEAARQMTQTVMSLQLAKKCIDDLAEFPNKIKKLSFSSQGEPLVNKNLAKIVEYAKKRDVAEVLAITTNGSLLTPEVSENLINAGLNHFDISIYGMNSEAYTEFTGSSTQFQTLIENISFLYKIKKDAHIAIKICDAACKTESEKELFFELFTPLCDKICYEHAVSLWYDLDISVADDSLDIYGNKVVEKEICPVPFFSMVIQANGHVTPCCVDWRQNLVLGNAANESLFSIWNGQKYKDLYTNLLMMGNNGVFPCKNCRYHELVAIDNIDAFKTDILARVVNTNAV